jgi:hypothetical protein
MIDLSMADSFDVFRFHPSPSQSAELAVLLQQLQTLFSQHFKILLGSVTLDLVRHQDRLILIALRDYQGERIKKR